jgi:sulfur carrier protein ThiS
MKIRVRYSAVLHIDGLDSPSVLEIPEGTSIAGLLTEYGVSREHQRYIAALINGEQAGLSRILRGGDKLDLLLPIGGG